MGTLMSTSELARELGLSCSRVRRLAAEMGVAPLRHGRAGRTALWPPEAVDRLKGRNPVGNPNFRK